MKKRQENKFKKRKLVGKYQAKLEEKPQEHPRQRTTQED